MQQFNKNEQLKVKVYLATSENRQKLKNEDHVFESNNNQYLVVYTKSDLAHLDYLLTWNIYNIQYHDFMFSGVEGQMYYYMLIHAGAVNFIPGEYSMRVAKATQQTTVIEVDHENYTTYYFVNENEDMTSGQYSLVYIDAYERQSNGQADYMYLARREG